MPAVPRDPDAPLPDEEPFSGEEGSDDVIDPVAHFRGPSVGVEDPDIVGDVGPTDIPPGSDSDGGLLAEEPEGESSG